VLAAGAEHAHSVASATIATIKERMGFAPSSA
jgi:hypothetical protein